MAKLRADNFMGYLGHLAHPNPIGASMKKSHSRWDLLGDILKNPNRVQAGMSFVLTQPIPTRM